MRDTFRNAVQRSMKVLCINSESNRYMQSKQCQLTYSKIDYPPEAPWKIEGRSWSPTGVILNKEVRRLTAKAGNTFVSFQNRLTMTNNAGLSAF